jgi:hypothetical protein
MLLSGANPAAARAALEQSGGTARAAIALLLKPGA